MYSLPTAFKGCEGGGEGRLVRRDVPDSDALALVLDHRVAVVVFVEVVGRAEHGDHRRELIGHGLAVHQVPRILPLVPAEDAQQLVALQGIARRLVPTTLVRARTNMGSSETKRQKQYPGCPS